MRARALMFCLAAYVGCGLSPDKPTSGTSGEDRAMVATTRGNQALLDGSTIAHVLAGQPVLNEPALKLPELSPPAVIPVASAPVTCDALMPRRPLAPRRFGTPSDTGSCDSATSDFSGNDYFLRNTGYDDFSVVDMVSAGMGSEYNFGSPAANYLLSAGDPIALANGVLIGGTGHAPLRVVRPNRIPELAYPQQAIDISASTVLGPNGGGVFIVNHPFGGLDLIRFDAQGQQTWTLALQSMPFNVGIDTRGYLLLLYGSEDCHPSGYCASSVTYGITGQWIDPSGIAQSKFTLVSGITSGAPTLLATPRVEGGFFLWSGYGLQNVGSWILQIDEGSTIATPAPPWLTNLPPYTAIHLIHGNTGYALGSLTMAAGGCRHRIEIATDKGELCGAIETDVAGSFCADWFGYQGSGAWQWGWPGGGPGYRLVDIGADGTLFEGLPNSAPPGSGFSCSWQYWPQLFN